MSEYVPMLGPFPGVRWEPSNGTDGACFHEAMCCHCERDKEMNGTCHEEGRDAGDDDWCQILGASFRGEAVEWRELEDGSVTCVAFIPKGQKITARCHHTVDMFQPEAQS